MILTIDLDIIMEPCISLYNRYISGDSKENIWAILNKDLDINKHLSINKDYWQWLVDFIQQASQKNIPYIGYSDRHNDILIFLNYVYNHNKKLLGQDLIINIDHHHDLGYRFTEKEFSHLNINCANWAYYLLKTGYTNSYYWLHNKNSEIYNLQDLNIQHGIFNPENSDILLKNCNGIFFCTSSPWIPEQYNDYIIYLQSLLTKYFPNTIFLGNNDIISPSVLNLFKRYAKQPLENPRTGRYLN